MAAPPMDPSKSLPYPAQPGYGMPSPYNPGSQPAPYPAGYNAPPPQGPPQGFGYPPQQGASAFARTGMNQGLTGGYDSDAEGLSNQAGMGGSFGEKAVRRAFIRKVYGILMCQLLLTGAIICFFYFYEPLRLYSQRNQTLYWIACAVTFVCLIGMACCEGVRRKFPTNLIFLSVFTIAEGFMLGTLCAHFEATAILIAVGITCGVTLALTLFAFQTKIDFTMCGGMLCAMVAVLFIAGIVLAFTGMSKAAMIGYGTAGALIFSLYIIYDTQLMMGGKHKYALDPEEYIFASLNIYLDIVNLFIYILMIVGASSSSD